VLWRGVLDLLAPRRCAACGEAAAAALCEACSGGLPWLASGGRCSLCHEEIAEDARGFELCPACRLAEPALRGCVAAVAMTGDVRDWVRRFKYPESGLTGLDPRPRAVLRELVLEAASRARAGGPVPDRVIPVPLHRARLRQRGFNPAALLAIEIARTTRLPLECGWLVRRRDTPSQTGLAREQRRENVAGAFACRRRRTPAPRRVWLIDDVVTTGATLDDAALALRRHGVREVVGICVARTPRRSATHSSRSEPGGRADPLPRRRG